MGKSTINSHVQKQTVCLRRGYIVKNRSKIHDVFRQGTMLTAKPRDIGGLPAKGNEWTAKKICCPDGQFQLFTGWWFQPL